MSDAGGQSTRAHVAGVPTRDVAPSNFLARGVAEAVSNDYLGADFDDAIRRDLKVSRRILGAAGKPNK